MPTRRSFLVSAAAALLTPRMLDRFQNYLENHREPLIEAPKYADRTLCVSVEGDLRIMLGLGDNPGPVPIWRDFLTEVHGYDFRRGREEFVRARREWGMWPSQLDQQMDDIKYIEHWCVTDSPEAVAFDLLQNLDLGNLRGRGREVGGVYFNDLGYFPGHVYRAAHCYDLLSVSLLQARLNELETGIGVELVAV